MNGNVWEFKIPEGWNGNHTIRKQFFGALGKGTSKLLILTTENEAAIDKMINWLLTTFIKGDCGYTKEAPFIQRRRGIMRISWN